MSWSLSNQYETDNTKTTSLPGHYRLAGTSINQSSLKDFRHASETGKARLLMSSDVEENPGPGPHQTQQCRNYPVKVTTYNVRGLSDERKLRHLLNFCTKQNKGKDVDYICGLQETYVPTEGKIPYLWRGNYHLTPGTGQSCGCLALLSAHLNIIASKDIDSRAHILACQKVGVNKVSYIIANIYAPNPNTLEKVEFFEKVIDAVLEFQELYQDAATFVLGDFNLIFNPWEAKNRNNSAQEQRVASAVGDLLRTAGLADVWDKFRAFTWRRPNTDTFSTIDRIYYSKNSLRPAAVQDFWSLSCSDHAAIEGNFELIEQKPKIRARITRIDPSIVKNKELRERLIKGFEDMISTSLPSWNPHQKLEFAKMSIRTVAEKIQADRKVEEKTEEDAINEELDLAVNKLSSGGAGNRTESLIDYIEELRARKAHLVEEKGERLAERLGTKWYNEGEKSSRYFMRLLNRTMPDDFVIIEKADGEKVTEPEKIEEEIVNFYKNLYEETKPVWSDRNEIDSFFRHINPISVPDQDEITKPLVENDLRKTLHGCHDSAPGPDGIPYSILGALWPTFVPILCDAWNYSLATGNLPPLIRRHT